MKSCNFVQTKLGNHRILLLLSQTCEPVSPLSPCVPCRPCKTPDSHEDVTIYFKSSAIFTYFVILGIFLQTYFSGFFKRMHRNIERHNCCLCVKTEHTTPVYHLEGLPTCQICQDTSQSKTGYQ